MHGPILLESKNVSIQGFGPQMPHSLIGTHPNYQKAVYVVHSYAVANPPKNNLFLILFLYMHVYLPWW